MKLDSLNRHSTISIIIGACLFLSVGACTESDNETEEYDQADVGDNRGEHQAELEQQARRDDKAALPPPQGGSDVAGLASINNQNPFSLSEGIIRAAVHPHLKLPCGPLSPGFSARNLEGSWFPNAVQLPQVFRPDMTFAKLEPYFDHGILKVSKIETGNGPGVQLSLTDRALQSSSLPQRVPGLQKMNGQMFWFCPGSSIDVSNISYSIPGPNNQTTAYFDWQIVVSDPLAVDLLSSGFFNEQYRRQAVPALRGKAVAVLQLMNDGWRVVNLSSG